MTDGFMLMYKDLPGLHLAVVLFRTSVGSLLRIVQLLHQCYNLHISSPLLLMGMKCYAPSACCKCNQLRHLHCKITVQCNTTLEVRLRGFVYPGRWSPP